MRWLAEALVALARAERWFKAAEAGPMRLRHGPNVPYIRSKANLRALGWRQINIAIEMMEFCEQSGWLRLTHRQLRDCGAAD